MYCSYCGCKLDSAAKKCPSCGNDARSEYCGGFWGLVGEKEQQKPEPVEEKKDAQENQIMPVDSESKEKSNDMKKALPDNGMLKVEKKKQIRQKIVTGILLVSILLCIIQTVRLTALNRKFSDMQDENEMISQENGELMIEKEEAEKKNGNLESENKALKALNFEEANKGFLKSVLQIQGVE